MKHSGGFGTLQPTYELPQPYSLFILIMLMKVQMFTITRKIHKK